MVAGQPVLALAHNLQDSAGLLGRAVLLPLATEVLPGAVEQGLELVLDFVGVQDVVVPLLHLLLVLLQLGGFLDCYQIAEVVVEEVVLLVEPGPDYAVVVDQDSQVVGPLQLQVAHHDLAEVAMAQDYNLVGALPVDLDYCVGGQDRVLVKYHLLIASFVHFLVPAIVHAVLLS